MAELILIRHGQSQANLERRFAEDGTVPLTEQGEREAQATALVVKGRFSPSALYASPFRRAFDTACFIGREIGLEPTIVDRLHEQDYGELNGKGFAALADMPRIDEGDPWAWKPHGGESLRDVVERAGPALDEIADRHRGEQVVVVTHAGVMMALRAHVTRDFSIPLTLSGNASGFVVHRVDGGYEGPIAVEGLTKNVTPAEEVG